MKTQFWHGNLDAVYAHVERFNMLPVSKENMPVVTNLRRVIPFEWIHLVGAMPLLLFVGIRIL